MNYQELSYPENKPKEKGDYRVIKTDKFNLPHFDVSFFNGNEFEFVGSNNGFKIISFLQPTELQGIDRAIKILQDLQKTIPNDQTGAYNILTVAIDKLESEPIASQSVDLKDLRKQFEDIIDGADFPIISFPARDKLFSFIDSYLLLSAPVGMDWEQIKSDFIKYYFESNALEEKIPSAKWDKIFTWFKERLQHRQPAGKERLAKIVTVIGSTRFIIEMSYIGWEYEKMGWIALTPRLLPSQENESNLAEKENVKEIIDKTYLEKVAMADIVYVCNVGGYIGESTRNELNHAIKLGKEIKYLEQPTP